MRLFVAIDLSQEMRSEFIALQAQLRSVEQQLKIVPTENLHLTLQFLGECAQQQLPAISLALQSAAAGCPRFELELSGSGCFPNPRRPRVLWVGLKDQQDSLQNCVDMLGTKMADLGFTPDERAFSAHITVARVADRADSAQVMDVFSKLVPRSLTCQVQYLALYQSVLRAQGALYTCLQRAPLREAA